MRPDLKCLDETREIVRQFYESFFNGDTEGMLGLMADAVKVRFLAQVDLIGGGPEGGSD